MKTSQRTLIRSLALTLTVCLGVACGRGPQGPAGKMGSPGTNDSPKSEFGGSSGGGGFSSQNSQKLLEIASTKLAEMLTGATPIVFKELPKGWDQYKIASLIKSVRNASNVVEVRSDRELEFDYGTDSKGPYIRALKNFYTSYASTPVRSILERGEINGEDSKDFVLVVKDVMIKLAKEAAHVVLNHPVVQGKKLSKEQIAKIEAEADAFSIAMLDALETDNLICLASQDHGLLDAAEKKSPKVEGGYAVRFTFRDGTQIVKETDTIADRVDMSEPIEFGMAKELQNAELISKSNPTLKLSPRAQEKFLIAIGKAEHKMNLISGANLGPEDSTGTLSQLLDYLYSNGSEDSHLPPWMKEVDKSAYTSGYWRISKEAIQQTLYKGGYFFYRPFSGLNPGHLSDSLRASGTVTLKLSLAKTEKPSSLEYSIFTGYDLDKPDFLSSIAQSQTHLNLRPGGTQQSLPIGSEEFENNQVRFFGKMKIDFTSSSTAYGFIAAKIQRKAIPKFIWKTKNVPASIHCKDAANLWQHGRPGCSSIVYDGDPMPLLNLFELETTYEEPVEVKIPLECQSASSIFHWQDYL